MQGYKNNALTGVQAYGGKLDVRPAYQREYVYKGEQREAVINTVLNNFPLNVLYWVDNGDDNFEVLDGQQRIISICEYVSNIFHIKSNYFHSLSNVEKDKILNYKLMVYFCTGTDKEKLDWFTTINIAGEQLSNQELRNAVYTGAWLSDAKRYFSAPGQGADKISKYYVNVQVNRQNLLELSLRWIILDKKMKTIEEYMSTHQLDNDANELWTYFRKVINWIETTFVDHYSEMKSVDWGRLYFKYSENSYNSSEFSIRVKELRRDDEVTSNKGIYEFLLSGEEKHLSLRAFTESQKISQYEKQNGQCFVCQKKFDIELMQGDHWIPWSKKGKTTPENLKMLCRDCNNIKSNK
ncbi:HNH endonuclease family protein [Spiroplasma endosymbiont of Dioctria linearis]|uniref:HNH endonuclease family protein n=1 Tax=Spiroplasma endosymbiont of Dioctria linearis TaxID=3066290 RepID=UPI00313D33C2